MKNLAVLATLLIAYEAHAVKWKKGTNNDPSMFNIIARNVMQYDFDQLPLAAALKDDRYGWSETFWPSNLGGIAYRWNHPDPRPFTYRILTKEEVLRMSEEELSQLSPAELYDISQGDYKFSLTKKVLDTYSPDNLWWEGICHGWSLAAIHYPEPDKTVIINKDGVRVPFGASDVKGLLAMHEAFNSKGLYAQVGDRCGVEGKVPGEAFAEDGDISEPSEKDAARPECADTNAGAFHVVITNMIGRFSKGFVADVDRFNDVWNQPVFGYESEMVEELPVTSTDSRNGVFRKVRVKTKMIYGDELEFYTAEEAAHGTLGFVSKEPVTGTPAQTFGERNYEYVLELDSLNKIVGGDWISKSRPDFLWSKIKDTKFTSTPGNGTGFGLFLRRMFKKNYPLEGLSQIYRPVKR